MKRLISISLCLFFSSMVWAAKNATSLKTTATGHSFKLKSKKTINPAFADTVVRLPGISDLIAYTGKAKTVIVQDTMRGGIFSKLPKGILKVDSGLYFLSNKTDSLWCRQMNGNTLLAEWYGTNDGTSLQAAINATFNRGHGYIVGAKSPVIMTSKTIEIPVKNYAVNLINTTIEPSSTFPDNDTLVKIIGNTGSDTLASIYTAIKVDGLSLSKHLTGIQITANLIADQHTFYVYDCKYGVVVSGPCEKQNFNISGAMCTELVQNRADSAYMPNDYTPDENVYNITASQCTTYFHDYPNSFSSYQVKFNVENSLGGNYPVILEGSKLAKLSGEIRGSNYGGIYINSALLDVEFDGLHFHQTSGKEDITIDSAKQVNGTLYSSFAKNGGVYIGYVAAGGILNIDIGSLQGGDALTLGSISANQTTKNMIINYHAIIDTTPDPTGLGLLIDNAQGCKVYTTGLTSPVLLHKLNDVFLSLDAGFVASGTSLIDTSSTLSTKTIQILGSVTSANLAPYKINGMMALTVRDKAFGSAYYNGSTWIYESDNTQNAATATLTNKTLTTPVLTAPKLTAYTQATLPTTPSLGMQAIVTDATSTTYNTIVIGGGTNKVMVFYNGTNWIIY